MAAWPAASAGWPTPCCGPGGRPAATWSWCGGRAGLLLARAAVGAALGRRLTDERSLAALTAPVEEEPPSWPPGLCCGPAGILDAATEIDSRTGGGLLARTGAWAV